MADEYTWKIAEWAFGIFAILIGVIGYLLKNRLSAIETKANNNAADIVDLKVAVATLPTKDDLKEVAKDLKGALNSEMQIMAAHIDDHAGHRPETAISKKPWKHSKYGLAFTGEFDNED